MSNCTLQHTMIRIAGAPPESPIAVLRTTAPGKLNAVFADTLLTKEIITGESTALIGVFDKTMCMETVRQHLHTHVPKKEFL